MQVLTLIYSWKILLLQSLKAIKTIKFYLLSKFYLSFKEKNSSTLGKISVDQGLPNRGWGDFKTLKFTLVTLKWQMKSKNKRSQG